MKILLYGLNFAPELIGIGKYTGEMAQWLASRGHELRVVTSYPYYPQWKIDKGYGGFRYRRETWNGICVYRCPLWVPRSPRGGRRVLHLASFAASSAPVIAWQAMRWKPDIILGIEPTLLTAPAALVGAWLGDALSWLHVQDFEIAAAFETQLLRGDRLRRGIIALENMLLRSFDRVSTISPTMCEGLRHKGIAEDRIRFLPNWVDAREIFPMPGSSPMRRALAISDSAIVVLYAGNMSEKQGIDTLVDAAWKISNRRDIHIVFAGEGAARGRLQAASSELANVQFLPLQPAERLNELLNLADIHVLPQRHGVSDLVMPSKLLGMLASGRPVVAGAAPMTEIGKVVRGCGIVVSPEDGRAMAEAILSLAEDKPRRSRLGAAGRDLACRDFDKNAVLSRLENWFKEGRPGTEAVLGGRLASTARNLNRGSTVD